MVEWTAHNTHTVVIGSEQGVHPRTSQLTTLVRLCAVLCDSLGSAIDRHVVLCQVPVVIDVKNGVVAIRAIVKH